MKILLSNKYYYLRGGVDIYTIQLEKLLKDNGHEVAIFSMRHSLNLKSNFLDYFPCEIDLNKVSVKNLIPAIMRPFGSSEVRRKFSQLLRDFKPDVVHLNNIHSQISPVLSILARKFNVPVVWTLHDHKLLCPRYDCMRNNKPCELCFTSKLNVLRHNCMKNSLPASLIAYAEAIRWNRKIISWFTDLFICPSTFLLNNMVKGGYSQKRLITLPNFIDEKKLTSGQVPRQNHYCYVGRLSEEKGIETLLKAARELPQYVLKVIGTGPLENDLRARYEGENIEFLGFRNWEELSLILGSSRCMVIPSECYENNPLSVIESLCLGTPVIGSRSGGIPELINQNKNGLIFEPGNVNQLKEKINLVYHDTCKFDHEGIAGDARSKYNSGNYYMELIKIYNQMITKYSSREECNPGDDGKRMPA
jgi:glycosyltransferase involved in cell wall biosynthesis